MGSADQPEREQQVLLGLEAGAGASGPPSSALTAEPGSVAPSRENSPELPVASVLVDTGLPHLDRPFDYLVPGDLDESVVPGVRVRVRFAGRLVSGLVLDRVAEAQPGVRPQPLRAVVSPERVLTDHILSTAQRVASRYAGSIGDVLRLAIPPRHAGAERALRAQPARAPERPAGAAWRQYPAGEAFLARIAQGESPAASVLAPLSAPVEEDWPRLLAEAALTAASAGRGSVLVVPDARDVERVEAALIALAGRGHHVRLTADQGTQARYTAYLSVLRGGARIVVGTRAAAFAPVLDPGLLAWWDDGDDLHDEPRAPYPHVREVLRARADLCGSALLSLGFTRTAAMAAAVESGQCVALRPSSRSGPAVSVAGEGRDLDSDPAAVAAHLPSAAWRLARGALAAGPVLIQVPRRGYRSALSCQDCRTPSRCPRCAGPLVLSAADRPPGCRWCGSLAPGLRCSECGSARVRAGVVGASRTAEELGRAFPGVPVRTSGRDVVLPSVSGEPALVVATPGAEPVAEGGYAAALLLDAWAFLDRPSLDAGEEALRRWLAAAALVRPRDQGGAVVLCGVSGEVRVPAVEALVRLDPAWFAERELAERTGLHLPPRHTVVTMSGSSARVAAALGELSPGPPVRVFGPLAHGPSPGARAMLSVPVESAQPLLDEVRALRARESARKDPEPVRVRVDPRDPAASERPIR